MVVDPSKGGGVSEKVTISVVVPIYNEEESIEQLYGRLSQACEPMQLPYELIFVDDGSRDQSFVNLKKLWQQDDHIKVLRFRKNYGQTAAMVAGFEYATGEIIISMDGDLQNDPKDIPNLLAKMNEGFDVVCGWRKNRQDAYWSRLIPSYVANWIMGMVTGVKIHDSGCSLKAYKAEVIKKLPLYGEMHRFIPAMSLLVGARIGEIEVEHHARQFGQSKYGIGRIWKVALDIMVIRMITGFASRPLLWFGLLSVPCFVFGLAFFGMAIGPYFGQDFEQWLVPSIVSFLFLFLSGHLVTTGVIAELIVTTSDFIFNRLFLPIRKLI